MQTLCEEIKHTIKLETNIASQGTQQPSLALPTPAQHEEMLCEKENRFCTIIIRGLGCDPQFVQTKFNKATPFFLPNRHIRPDLM